MSDISPPPAKKKIDVDTRVNVTQKGYREIFWVVKVTYGMLTTRSIECRVVSRNMAIASYTQHSIPLKARRISSLLSEDSFTFIFLFLVFNFKRVDFILSIGLNRYFFKFRRNRKKKKKRHKIVLSVTQEN